MNYEELYEKYKALLEENNKLIFEIKQLKTKAGISVQHENIFAEKAVENFSALPEFLWKMQKNDNR